MILYVMGNYRNRNTAYQAGDVIEVSDTEGAHLQADAPGCFAQNPAPPSLEGEGEAKSFIRAPLDKMVRRARHK
jgi:hypothetical protein